MPKSPRQPVDAEWLRPVGLELRPGRASDGAEESPVHRIGASAGGQAVSRRAAGALPAESGTTRLRQAALGELCRRLVAETYAPAAVLINRKRECLYAVGPTERYLPLTPEPFTHDLIALARPGLRSRLRAALQRARRFNARILLPGGRTGLDAGTSAFNIDVQPVRHDSEALMLVCFVDVPECLATQAVTVAPGEELRIAELKHHLQTARTDLVRALHDLETLNREQVTINAEARSINEEYQSVNEELLTSKEELQSLNEELTALNGQLQETLARQRSTANDLQNILYSTDIAVLFLDSGLRIRFFTPTVKSLFSIIPGDIGRPLSDLSTMAFDAMLTNDAGTVLQDGLPIEREVEAEGGSWFGRRVLPYRSRDDRVDGVVITFADITEWKRAANTLEAAKRQAELANLAKSSFLATAGHELRQPLQSLALILGLLAKTAEGEGVPELVGRLEATLGMMSSMVNALLDRSYNDVRGIAGGAMGNPAHGEGVRFDKPAMPAERQAAIHRRQPAACAPSSSPVAGSVESGTPVIMVVDDDGHIREGIRAVLEVEGWIVEDFADCEAFLERYRPGREACLLIDSYLPGMNGLELLQRLRADGDLLPAIMITGNGDVPMAVQAMKSGASDFIEKPVSPAKLLNSIECALEKSRDLSRLAPGREDAVSHVAGLTARQREIMAMVLAGQPSKNIAADLGISRRTVENHRAAIMKKTGVRSLPALARLALAATSGNADEYARDRGRDEGAAAAGGKTISA
jgi:FixJ family two-component response regulator/PAS domain-containing protein